MTSADIVARLTHHHLESEKCVADYYRFLCDCGARTMIDNVHFNGGAFLCKCKRKRVIDFKRALAEAGPAEEQDGDPWGNALSR